MKNHTAYSQSLCTVIFAALLSTLVFEADLGRDLFRLFGVLLLLIPFMGKYYSKNILIFALLGLFFSLSISLGNITSDYVVDWTRGLTSSFYWVMILPIYLLVQFSKPTLDSLFRVLFFTCVIAAVPGISDYVQGEYRYSGMHGTPIAWGNLSLLTGVLCLAFAPYYLRREKKNLAALSILGFGLGCFASFISQTRSGWIVLFILVPYILYLIFKQLPSYSKLFFGGCTLLFVVSAIYFNAERVEEAFVEVENYIYRADSQSRASSVGSRFEFWKSSLRAIKSHPIKGIGSQGFHSWINQDKDFNGEKRHKHPHNYYFSLLLMGLLSTLLFASLIAFFLKHTCCFNSQNEELSQVRLLSIVLFLSFSCFSLTTAGWGLSLCLSYFILVSVYLLFLSEHYDDTNNIPSQSTE